MFGNVVVMRCRLSMSNGLSPQKLLLDEKLLLLSLWPKRQIEPIISRCLLGAVLACCFAKNDANSRKQEDE